MRGPAGRYITFDAPGASATDTSVYLNHPGTAALDVNDAGQIIGVYSGPGGKARGFTAATGPGASEHGFSRTADGTFARIDLAGARSTSPTRINDRGQIVGTYTRTGADQDGL